MNCKYDMKHWSKNRPISEIFLGCGFCFKYQQNIMEISIKYMDHHTKIPLCFYFVKGCL